MLVSIGSVENVPRYLASVKAKETRLMGFGHRVYRTVDPRSRIAKQIAQEVRLSSSLGNATGRLTLVPCAAAQMGALLGRDRISDIAEALEAAVLADPHFTAHHLFPNVDLYSTVAYHNMGTGNTWSPGSLWSPALPLAPL